jgi:4-hydroxy-tetrahydrodipicolinate synthase
MIFTGSGVALVTPFSDNTVNTTQLQSLIEWHIKAGTQALIILGTTGEGVTLSNAEKKEVFTLAVRFAKRRIKIIANTGSNDTAASIELSLFAQSVGADGLLLVCPYYNKPSQRGLIAHFTAIADAVNLPCILYNVPGRTAVNLSAESCLTLARHRNIVGVKEASHDLAQIETIIKHAPKDFAVYSGNDDQNDAILALGGYGVISVTGNIIPERLAKFCIARHKGNALEAKAMHEGMMPLHDVLFIESNPVPVKAALTMMGHPVGSVRLPLVELEAHNALKLRTVLIQQGLVTEDA